MKEIHWLTVGWVLDVQGLVGTYKRDVSTGEHHLKFFFTLLPPRWSVACGHQSWLNPQNFLILFIWPRSSPEVLPSPACPHRSEPTLKQLQSQCSWQTAPAHIIVLPCDSSLTHLEGRLSEHWCPFIAVLTLGGQPLQTNNLAIVGFRSCRHLGCRPASPSSEFTALVAQLLQKGAKNPHRGHPWNTWLWWPVGLCHCLIQDTFYMLSLFQDWET